jgi:hypothetical protein
MKAFVASIGLLIVICVAASYYLTSTQMSAENVYSTDSVRLN